MNYSNTQRSLDVTDQAIWKIPLDCTRVLCSSAMARAKVWHGDASGASTGGTTTAIGGAILWCGSRGSCHAAQRGRPAV